MTDRRAEFASDAVAIDRRRSICAVDGCAGEAIMPIPWCSRHMDRDLRPFVAQLMGDGPRLLVMCNQCVRKDLRLRQTGTHYRQGHVPMSICERCGTCFQKERIS